MRRPTQVLALGLALAIFLVSMAPSAAADAEKPTWSTGDFWAYEYTGSAFTWINGPGTYRMEVVGIDTVSIGGASYEAYRLRLTVNGSNVVQYHGGDVWYRTSDLSLVKLTYNATVTVFFELTVIVTLTYDPPAAIRWPLVTQDTWTTSSSRTAETQLPPLPPVSTRTNVDTSYIVEASSTVTVPAGSLETTPLRAQSGERSTTYWAASAGNYARRQTRDANDQETSSAELTSFRYSPALFGLPLIVWILILVLLIIVVAAFVSRARRRPQTPMPPYMPPQGPPRQ